MSALDRVTGQKVAIKQMKDVFRGISDATRVYREMNILRNLRQSKMIVRLLDVICPNALAQDGREVADSLQGLGEIYLVFEFMDTDLKKILESPQYIDREKIKYIMYQLLCGLKYIHSANVIHRDLKPANILINCIDCSLKIADFGLSRVVDTQVISRSYNTEQPLIPPSLSCHDDLHRPDARMDEVDHSALTCGDASSDMDISDDHNYNSFTATTVSEAAGCGGITFGSVSPARLSRTYTKHVVTRYYRAPEIILTQPYNSSIDVWSAGCIFAELLFMLRENVSDFNSRRCLFPGSHCSPLSPGAFFAKQKPSQLEIIFNVIGSPSPDELHGLDEASTNFISSLQTKVGKNLTDVFPGSTPDELSLLKSMLLFNSSNRITVDDALQHPYFSSVRRATSELEAECTSPMSILLESIDEDVTNLFESVIDEIYFYHQQDSPVDDDSL